MNYKKILITASILTTVGLFLPRGAMAVPCNAQVGSTVTVSSSCTFSGTKDGVDAGAGTGNTGVISITSGATLTVGAGQTIAYGSITKGAGGGSIIKTGGGVLLKAGIWYTDADSDGYGASTTPVVQSSQPANSRRRNVMTNVATADCDDASASIYQNLTGYGGADSDGDTFRAGSSSQVCSGASLPAGYSASQDCYDSNANAKPGQTTYYAVNRGDGSYDYDCSSGTLTKIVYCNNQTTSCTDVGFGTGAAGNIPGTACSTNLNTSADSGCNSNRGVVCCR